MRQQILGTTLGLLVLCMACNSEGEGEGAQRTNPFVGDVTFFMGSVDFTAEAIEVPDFEDDAMLKFSADVDMRLIPELNVVELRVYEDAGRGGMYEHPTLTFPGRVFRSGSFSQNGSSDSDMATLTASEDDWSLEVQWGLVPDEGEGSTEIALTFDHAGGSSARKGEIGNGTTQIRPAGLNAQRIFATGGIFRRRMNSDSTKPYLLTCQDPVADVCIHYSFSSSMERDSFELACGANQISETEACFRGVGFCRHQTEVSTSDTFDYVVDRSVLEQYCDETGGEWFDR